MSGTRKQKLNMGRVALALFTFLLCVVTSVILFYSSILPTIALEQELRCGIEEHIHNDGCYTDDLLTCEVTAHVHDGNCYIVLLKENDINGVLTLVDENKPRSLEAVISNVVSSALTFNDDLNTPEPEEAETPTLTQDTVMALNATISEEETLPDLVLNEGLNNPSTLALEEETVTEEESEVGTGNFVNGGGLLLGAGNTIGTNGSANGGSQLLSVGDTPGTSNGDANIYVYLDKSWQCIGTLDFTTGWNYYNYRATLPTNDLLNLIEESLGITFAYNGLDVSVLGQNGSYSTQNASVGQSTVVLATASSNSNTLRSAKTVRLIAAGSNATSTSLAFYTVKLVYPGGGEEIKYARSGTQFTLPEGYEWTSDGVEYEGGDKVTIDSVKTFYGTLPGPPTAINIHYDVDFPVVSGVTIQTTPTLAGLTVTEIKDVYSENSTVTVRNVSQQSVQGTVNNNSTGLTRVVQFKGWRVGDSETLIQPNTQLVWDELLQYSKYQSNLYLTAVWEYSPLQTATFFIRFDSVAVDTNGNITGQDSNLYTKQIFAAYVGGIDTSLSASQLHNKYNVADSDSDNSFGADQAIRALYGERSDGVWLSAFPSDDFVFESLVNYAKTGYLSVDGVAVKAEDLNSREYAIRWYVFKCQDDAWHIDGKLVKKVGLIHVYKTFAGNKGLIAEAKKDFYIDALDVSTGVNTVLTLNNATTHDSVNDTYMWEITDVDYGELWEITEHPHRFEDPEVEFNVYSEFTVMDAHGDQSVTGSGTSLTVSGMTYALDEGKDEVLRAEFTNIYNRQNSIIIKKQDSLTGVSIGGAVFRLLQNGQALKFNYNAETASYEYDPVNGTMIDLDGTANGYFELSIEDFSYDAGPIIVREVTPPPGYSPIGDIEIGYTEDDSLGILSGNSEMIKYMNGILIVGNTTDASSVTAKKNWDCPETEWQPVTVQLLANQKLVTTVIAGVEPQVLLSAENNWTHTWKNLPAYVNGDKIEWTIKETQIGTEAAKADGSFINWLVSYELPVKTTDAEGNENTLLAVTNTTKRVMLRLTKTDLSKSVQLPGATFLLEAVDADGKVLSTEVTKTATTGENGTLIFDNMKCNIRYRLTETEAPETYLRTEEYIYFTIEESGAVTVEENYFAEAGSTAYNIIVRNASGLPLPSSGGIGLDMFYAIGLLLIAAATGIYIYSTFLKRRCQNL